MHKRHHQGTEAVIGDVMTEVMKLAERCKTTGHGSPNVDGHSEIAVDENSLVLDDSDGTNKCASNRDWTAGKL